MCPSKVCVVGPRPGKNAVSLVSTVGLEAKASRPAHLDTLPALVPVPQLDGHVVGAGEDEVLGGVHGETSDVVWVRLEGCDALLGVVVVDAEVEVVAAADEPVLAGDEGDGAHGDLGDLERLYERFRLVVPDDDAARVQAGNDPWVGRVEVDGLDP